MLDSSYSIEQGAGFEQEILINETKNTVHNVVHAHSLLLTLWVVLNPPKLLCQIVKQKYKRKRNFHHFHKHHLLDSAGDAPLLVLEETNKQCCYLLIIMCLFHYLNHPTPRRKKKEEKKNIFALLSKMN